MAHGVLLRALSLLTTTPIPGAGRLPKNMEDIMTGMANRDLQHKILDLLREA